MTSTTTFAHTVAFLGIEPRVIEIQVQVAPGLPTFQLVGLPNKTVAESKERIRATFYSLGFSLPPKRITINLAPADLPKEGSHYDLPIAIGLLVHLGVLPKESCDNYLSMGELGLDGKLTIEYGVLPSASTAKKLNKGFICPSQNFEEANISGNTNILAPKNLFDLIGYWKNSKSFESVIKHSFENSKEKDLSTLENSKYSLDMSDILGQSYAKKAAEIAAAGGHHLLMIGPPGAGKSMLAARMPSILPKLSVDQALETTTVYSLAGMLKDHHLLNNAPFRAPHHTASLPSLVGGGSRSKPGEISLAHNGILFLDEMPEFSRSALEALRQPLENYTINVSRANYHVTYPARFQLIAAMNPCRCGFFSDSKKQCHRIPICAQDYQTKISGPLMDRFDLVAYMSTTPFEDLDKKNTTKKETSMDIKNRVENARKRQYKRSIEWFNQPILNAHLGASMLKECQQLSDDCHGFLEKVYNHYQLSARSYHRLLKICQTIADLQEVDIVEPHHITQALQFRFVPVVG